MAKFVLCDGEGPCRLRSEMCDGIPVDVLASLVIEAVELVNSSKFRINQRGTGSGRCEPRTLLAVLIYCYEIGTFRSRRIEPPACASQG